MNLYGNDRKQVEEGIFSKNLTISTFGFEFTVSHLRDREDKPRDIAVLGENVEASARLSAILLLSIKSNR